MRLVGVRLNTDHQYSLRDTFKANSHYMSQKSYEMVAVKTPEKNLHKERFFNVQEIVPAHGIKQNVYIGGVNDNGIWKLSTSMKPEELKQYITQMKASAQQLFPLGKIMQANKMMKEANILEKALKTGMVNFDMPNTFLMIQ